MDVLGLLIAQEETEASNGATFERRNPISGNVATKAAAATVDDALAAVDAAAAAFPEWSRSSPRERRAILSKAADILALKEKDFIEAMAAEIGATAGWAHFNVLLASDMLREAAALTTQITGEVIPSNRPGSLAMGVRQPAGVVLSMAPPAASTAPLATASLTSWPRRPAAAASTTQPSGVLPSVGSPALRLPALAASAATKASAILSSTTMRSVDMQIWPWFMKAPKAEAATAASMSASSSTTSGALPPSSSRAGFR